MRRPRSYLFHVGDVAGDVLHSDGILHGQSVALTLHSSSVNHNPGICGQACKSEEPRNMCPVCMIDLIQYGLVLNPFLI